MSVYSQRTQDLHQRDLEEHARALEHSLRGIEGMLMQGAEWNEHCASEWRQAKETADRIKARLGDPSKPGWEEG